MNYLKRYTIIGIFFVLITGMLTHFLYDLTSNNHIVGLFSPINESVWEHMKLIFFPMLIYSFIMVFKFKAKYPCIVSSLCFGNLIGTSLIPIFFYAYTNILNENIFILDIGTFILSTVIAFIICYKFTLSCKLKPFTILLCGLIAVSILCFMLFTYQPPDLKIFVDPTTCSLLEFDTLI